MSDEFKIHFIALPTDAPIIGVGQEYPEKSGGRITKIDILASKITVEFPLPPKWYDMVLRLRTR